MASAGGAGTRHRFVGQLGHTSDGETGLLYMRARYYDPVLGRFVSEDPARDGGNWFAYASGNPTNRCDATGGSDFGVDEVTRAVIYDWLKLFAKCGAEYAMDEAGKALESLGLRLLGRAKRLEAEGAAEVELGNIMKNSPLWGDSPFGDVHIANGGRTLRQAAILTVVGAQIHWAGLALQCGLDDLW